MRDKQKALPKTIYAAWEKQANEGPILLADEIPGDLIEDDGPTRIATYQLVEVHTYRKTVKIVTEVE